jgi:C4-dicarboxylate-specific signal transduction histidine kinase
MAQAPPALTADSRSALAARALRRARPSGPAWRAFGTGIVVTVCLVLIWTLAVTLVQRAGRDAAEKAHAQADVAAAALEQFVLRTIEGIESTFAFVEMRRVLETAGDRAAADLIAAHLADIAATNRLGVVQIADIDTNAVLRWSSTGAFPRADFFDRQAFLAHLGGARGLLVGVPQIEPINRRWTVQFSRRIEDSTGRFLGVAVMSLDPVALSRDIAEMMPGQHDVMFIVRRDGTYIARSRAPLRALAEEVAIAAPLPGPGATGTTPPVLAATQPDQRERFSSFRVLGGIPLIVGTGIDAAQALTPVRDFARLAVVTALLTSALVLLLALYARRRHERLHARAEVQEARLAERAAGAARAEIEALLAGLPVAVYRARIGRGSGMEVTYASAGMSALPDAAKALTEEEAAARSEFIARLLSGRDAVVEYPVARSDGSVTWLRDAARVVLTLQDGCEVVGYRADITAERRLAARATEAAKLATLGEMATGLAHELNQPITAMSLGADNAADALEAEGPRGIPEALETLRSVAGQAARAQTIIDHLRVFGRRDAGPLGTIDVRSAVEGAVVLAGAALRAAGVEVERDLPDDLPPVQGQLVLIEQVLVNLSLNARDAMLKQPEGTRRLVFAARRSSARDRVLLSVRDTGGGIPEAVLGRVFEPFFTTKPVGQGTGLGLAICHGIMAAQGGAIRVANAGRGAEFTLEFAIAEREDAPLAGSGAHAAAAEEAGHVG